jgi:hypothetical protein
VLISKIKSKTETYSSSLDDELSLFDGDNFSSFVLFEYTLFEILKLND